MKIYHTTLRKICDGKSTFPEYLRRSIIQSVEKIPPEAMPGLLSKNESDADNFDGRIEQNIRKNSPCDIELLPNHRITNRTKFNCDLVIHSDNDSVCLEIEKGDSSRFELDILKMQAFADAELRKVPKRQVYGAFIVPANNVVDRKISGSRNESSYKYLNRLCCLLCGIHSLSLSDILIVGYLKTELGNKAKSKKSHRYNSDKLQVNHSIKIGKFVRRTFERLFRENKLSQEMLGSLKEADYSKNIFGIPYPILKRIDPNKPTNKQRLDNRGRARYWSQEFDDGKYLVCSQWFERHRKNFIQWVSQFE